MEALKDEDKKIIDELAKEVRQLSSYAPNDDDEDSKNNDNTNNDNETISLLPVENSDYINLNTTTIKNNSRNSSSNSNSNSSNSSSTNRRKHNKNGHFTLYHIFCSFLIGIIMMITSTYYLIITDIDILDKIKNNISKK
jgi:hypothetical protein